MGKQGDKYATNYLYLLELLTIKVDISGIVLPLDNA